ncbi:MAG: hypothetical protein N4A53_08310 [Pelagimonas sp.]|nr:hypothetical protein [Pelagimonas sp.]
MSDLVERIKADLVGDTFPNDVKLVEYAALATCRAIALFKAAGLSRLAFEDAVRQWSRIEPAKSSDHSSAYCEISNQAEEITRLQAENERLRAQTRQAQAQANALDRGFLSVWQDGRAFGEGRAHIAREKGKSDE